MLSHRAIKRREVWRREMLEIGNLLLDALALERHLNVRYSQKPADDVFQQWRMCQRGVTRLAEDYAHAVARYRRVVRTTFATRN